MKQNSLYGLIAATLLLIASVGVQVSHAKDRLPAPTGKQVLEVTGMIDATTDGTSAYFDIDQLMALGPKQITTATPWTSGTVNFVGIPVKALLDAVKASGETLSVTALNDYTASMPIDVLTDANAILVFARDILANILSGLEDIWVSYNVDWYLTFFRHGFQSLDACA